MPRAEVLLFAHGIAVGLASVVAVMEQLNTRASARFLFHASSLSLSHYRTPRAKRKCASSRFFKIALGSLDSALVGCHVSTMMTRDPSGENIWRYAAASRPEVYALDRWAARLPGRQWGVYVRVFRGYLAVGSQGRERVVVVGHSPQDAAERLMGALASAP